MIEHQIREICDELDIRVRYKKFNNRSNITEFIYDTDNRGEWEEMREEIAWQLYHRDIRLNWRLVRD